MKCPADCGELPPALDAFHSIQSCRSPVTYQRHACVQVLSKALQLEQDRFTHVPGANAQNAGSAASSIRAFRTEKQAVLTAAVAAVKQKIAALNAGTA